MKANDEWGKETLADEEFSIKPGEMKLLSDMGVVAVAPISTLMRDTVLVIIVVTTQGG